MFINYKGPIYNCSGYSQIKFLFLNLFRRGVKIKLNHFGNKEQVDFFYFEDFQKLEKTELEKPYINIVSGIAPQLRRDNEAAYNIGYSMFETNTVPENWIQFYNEMDEIWTPSTFCKKSLNIKDLKCIITIIPIGVDTEVFSPKKREEHSFTFLSVGKWVDRKGWDLLINAYTSEFIGDFNIRLCIKTDEQTKTKEELIKEYLTTDRTSHMPRILINNQKVGEKTLPLFYNEADCYILPSRGEAFGIPFLEAMASGIPVIASDFGGQLDFVNEEVGWLIPIHTLRHLSDRLCKINSAYKNLWFAEPDIKDVREVMRYVYKNQEEVKKKGFKSRELVEEKFTWNRVTDLAEKRLKEIWRLL